MPAVLTMASKLVCVHGGTVQIPPLSHPLTVDGQAVLVQNDVMNAPIPDCPNKGSPGQVPCTLVTSVTAGLSTTLTVGGQTVLLATAQGLTNGAPPLPVLWQVQSAGQNKLTAT